MGCERRKVMSEERRQRRVAGRCRELGRGEGRGVSTVSEGKLGEGADRCQVCSKQQDQAVPRS